MANPLTGSWNAGYQDNYNTQKNSPCQPWQASWDPRNSRHIERCVGSPDTQGCWPRSHGTLAQDGASSALLGDHKPSPLLAPYPPLPMGSTSLTVLSGEGLHSDTSATHTQSRMYQTQLIYSMEVSLLFNKITGPNAAMVSPWHAFNFSVPNDDCTVMRRWKTGIRPQKCVIRQSCRCVNVIELTYTNLDNIAYYTPRLYGIAYLLLGYKPVQHVTVLNILGNYNTTLRIIIL